MVLSFRFRVNGISKENTFITGLVNYPSRLKSVVTRAIKFVWNVTPWNVRPATNITTVTIWEVELPGSVCLVRLVPTYDRRLLGDMLWNKVNCLQKK